MNFTVANADKAIAAVLARYEEAAKSLDRTDGVSLEFETWRFNLRKSNTEPLVRLNAEARGDAALLGENLSAIQTLMEHAAR